MSDKRKVTVKMSVGFIDMEMETTDVAIDVIRSVLATGADACHAEIKQALEDAGAKDVVIQMVAY